MFLITAVFAALLALTLVVSVKTLRFTLRHDPLKTGGCAGNEKKPSGSGSSAGDVAAVADILSKAVRIPTVSHTDARKINYTHFTQFHSFLETSFPKVHRHLRREVVNTYSLLYVWKGSGKAGRPVLLSAHMDVVAVEEGTEEDWRFPPFSGAVRDGFVWGRGTLDTKVTLISAMYSVEKLLETDFVPDRDVYFAFGHDEEGNATQGAKMISAHLASKGIEFEYQIDEGGAVVENMLDGIRRPVAAIGIAEKGFANIRLTLQGGGEGGHTSMPPLNTTIGRLAKQVVQLEQHPMRPRMGRAAKEILQAVGPEMTGGMKVALANLWLFKPLVVRVMSATRTGNALLRTTAVPTVFKAGSAENCMAEKASVVLNCRIAPGDTVADLIRHIKKVVGASDIQVEVSLAQDPSSVSRTDTEGYRLLSASITHIFGDVLISPYIVMGATDARNYENISRNIYRFAPYHITDADLKRIHGANERISLENIGKCVRFFDYIYRHC